MPGGLIVQNTQSMMHGVRLHPWVGEYKFEQSRFVLSPPLLQLLLDVVAGQSCSTLLCLPIHIRGVLISDALAVVGLSAVLPSSQKRVLHPTLVYAAA